MERELFLLLNSRYFRDLNLVQIIVINLYRLIWISSLLFHLLLKFCLFYLWATYWNFMFFIIIFLFSILNFLEFLLRSLFAKWWIVKLNALLFNIFPSEFSKLKKFTDGTEIFACYNHIRMVRLVYPVFFHLVIS